MMAPSFSDMDVEPAEENKGNGGIGEQPTESAAFNLRDRDPTHMNDILRLNFTDIIAEPGDDAYSQDEVFQKAYETFTKTKSWWYKMLTMVCAMPIAWCLGCQFACLSFNYIWCFRPHLKAFEISMFFAQKMYGATVRAFLVPLYNAMGRVFSRVRIVQAKSDSAQPLLEDV